MSDEQYQPTNDPIKLMEGIGILKGWQESGFFSEEAKVLRLKMEHHLDELEGMEEGDVD